MINKFDLLLFTIKQKKPEMLLYSNNLRNGSDAYEAVYGRIVVISLVTGQALRSCCRAVFTCERCVAVENIN